jgi:putative membrane protein
MLTRIDQDRIEAAVTSAEETTAAEIVVVVAAEVSNYREVPLAWAAAVALILPPLALLLGIEPMSLATKAGVWIAGQARALEAEFMLALGLYAVTQAVLFLVIFALCEIPAVRRALTPKVLKRHRVERVAQQQFAAIGSRAREAETGVLIFVAIDDRQVRILSPGEVHDKVGEPVWARAVAAIAQSMASGRDPGAGIVEAVAICGAALSRHYPAGAATPHDITNRPIEI